MLLRFDYEVKLGTKGAALYKDDKVKQMKLVRL
jgi:hypothetical protein